HGADELDDSGRATAALEESERSLDLARTQRVPLAAKTDQRLLRRCKLAQLVLGELDVADREPPVERCDRVARQETARDRGRARRDEGDAGTARRKEPPTG